MDRPIEEKYSSGNIKQTKKYRLTPIIYTKDIQGTIDFYVEKLGFVCIGRAPEFGWAKVCLNDAEIMISSPNSYIKFDKSVFTGSFYIYTDNADEVWEKVKLNVSVCYPIENFNYGLREFGIFDNNGYLLQFGHEIS